MTLRNEVDADLWEAVRKNYEAENYTGAILDSIFRLTETIRNKTGLEGDGASLIGQAFGGDNPRIKLNKLQTDSEKDVQRGIQEILRGIYTAVRNPRSHDAAHDSKATADAVIHFVNYLLGLVDNSKLSFDVEDFLKRVFDPYFVETVQYAKLLIQDIPKRQRADIAITTILRRREGDVYALGCFLHTLLDQLEDAQLCSVCKVVSDELKVTTERQDIRYLLHIIPAGLWPRLDQAVRLRTESILFEDFAKASYDIVSGDCGEYGSLAAWVTAEHLMHFAQLDKWTKQTVDMLRSIDLTQSDYVETYFWEKICRANTEKITMPLWWYFKQGLQAGDTEILDRLDQQIKWRQDHPWWNVFRKELEAYPEIQYREPVDLPF